MNHATQHAETGCIDADSLDSASLLRKANEISDFILALAGPDESVETEKLPCVSITQPVESKLVSADSRAIDGLSHSIGLMPDLGPAFRGYPPLPAMIRCQDERNELMRRRVEDIIYLHRVGRRFWLDSSLGGGKYREMLMGDSLDIGKVRDFVDYVSSPYQRMTDEHIAVRLLFIPENLQVRLCQLATDEIKAKRRTLLHKEPVICARLLKSVNETGDRKLARHVHLWGRLWVAQELIRYVRTGKVPSGKECSPQEVGLLLGAMTGKRMERSEIRRKLKTIEMRLGVDR